MELTDSNWYIILKDILTFGVTVAGLIIAGMGLATWKKQIKGAKEFEVAYDLHYSILKLRNAIRHVRHPGIWPSESRKAIEYSKLKYPDKNLEEIEKNPHAYVYEMRWEKITEADTEIESHLLAGEVLWGYDIKNQLKPLDTKVTELNIALQQRFQPELRTKSHMEIHDIMYDQLNDSMNDKFGREIDKIIESIATYLKQKIT